MWILIVEDDRRMAGLVKKGLEEEGHSVTVAFDGREGLEAARRNAFDAIVLDVMMPGLDGFEVARRLREGRIHTPILMLTARDAATDIVKGLDIGADDYLTKPFSLSVFFARLRSVVRRGMAPQSSRLQVADLVLDPATHEVFRGTRKIALTPTEFRLLEFLMRRAGRVVSRSSIIDAVWGFDQQVENNTLDAFISLLRNKIDNDHPRRLIHTVRGFGYSVRTEAHL